MLLSRWSRLSMRAIALLYLLVLLLIPIGAIFARTFEHGFGTAWSWITTPAAISAFWLSVTIALIAVPLNTIFGVGSALLLARSKVRGRKILDALIDLPFVVSPVIVGLALVLVYGKDGWFGNFFLNRGIQIIYAVPGMVIATVFVSLPFVVREVTPVLIEAGDEQEQAAATLGASEWQTFWRVTLPSIRWGVAYGVVLTTARALGEIGAVAIVSSNVAGSTLTCRCSCTQRDQTIGAGQITAAYAAATELAVMSLIVLLAMTLLGPRKDPDEDRRARRVEEIRRVRGAHDVTLEVPEGSLMALLGPSGSGKSTLLRIIAGLEQPDSGHVLIDGDDVTAARPQDRGIGFVFQHYAAFAHMTRA